MAAWAWIFACNAVVNEELAYAGSSAGITLHSDIVAEYIERYGSLEQREKFLQKMVTGEVITAIAMTEPGAGSDLQGIRTTAKRYGNHCRRNACLLPYRHKQLPSASSMRRCRCMAVPAT